MSINRRAKPAQIADDFGHPSPRVPESFEVDRRPDDWGLYCNFDQFLYSRSDDPRQGFGLFGRFGWSTGEANAFGQFYSLGLGSKALLRPTRDKDNIPSGLVYGGQVSSRIWISS